MLRCFCTIKFVLQFLVGCLERISWPLLRKHHWIIMRFLAPKLCKNMYVKLTTGQCWKSLLWNEKFMFVWYNHRSLTGHRPSQFLCKMYKNTKIMLHSIWLDCPKQVFFQIKSKTKYLWWWYYWVLSAIMTGAVTLWRLQASLAAVWD